MKQKLHKMIDNETIISYNIGVNETKVAQGGIIC